MEILTIKQAAKKYGLPEYALRALVKRGTIPVIQSGRRCYISREAFEEYLRKGGEVYAERP